MDINLPRHQRHRGDPPDHRRAPRRDGAPALDVPGRRPPERRRHLRRGRLRQQGGVRPRRRARPLGSAKPQRTGVSTTLRPALTPVRGVSLGEGDAAGDLGALAGRGVDGDAAAEGADAVAHVHEAVAVVRAALERRSRRRCRRPRTASAPSTSRSVTVASRAVARVLARVLQRLEAAEVDGGLDLLRVAADVLGLDRSSAARRGRRRRAARRAGRGP